MKIETRIGTLNLREEKIITFVSGILGLEQYKKYLLLDHPDTDIIKWLQSVENPNMALPVTNPYYFYPHYNPKIPQQVLSQLDLKSLADAVMLNVVTVPREPKKATINLKAPIVINPVQRKADQVIVEYPEYQIREPLNLLYSTDNRRCESC